jgi:excisionase family DNA binding protein
VATFFISDHHFGHQNILIHCAETRRFATVEDMNEAYLTAWNAVVKEDDEVWYLGDFSMKFEYAEGYLPMLNGRKHLIIGNHDKCFKNDGPEQVGRYLSAGFATVQRQAVVELEGRRFLLNHFPYYVPLEFRDGSQEEQYLDRFAQHQARPGKNAEVALIHGHVHQLWRIRQEPGRLPEINVSVDALSDGAPISSQNLLTAFRDFLTNKKSGAGEPSKAVRADVDAMLTTDEAAQMLGCSRTQVIMLVDNDQLPGAMKSAADRRRIPLFAVKDYMATHQLAKDTIGYQEAAQ